MVEKEIRGRSFNPPRFQFGFVVGGKIVYEYPDGKHLSIYIDEIIDDIIVEFKKANFTVRWYIYQ